MNTEEVDFRMLSIFDEESVPIDDGRLQWVPVRRRLGIGSFGINAYRAADAGDAVVEDHVESPGQEELYVVVCGRTKFQVGDDTVDAPAGSAIFVSEPDVRRSGVALEDGTVVLAVGGWRDPALPLTAVGADLSRAGVGAAGRLGRSRRDSGA